MKYGYVWSTQSVVFVFLVYSDKGKGVIIILKRFKIFFSYAVNIFVSLI
jgi:hypothetical protein